MTPGGRTRNGIEGMKPLEPPEIHYVTSAEGWIGLGNLSEARKELGQIAQEQQSHPDVLEVWWHICAEEKDWQEGLRVARALLAKAPERSSGWLHQAYALRRVEQGGIRKAWEALLPAFDKFPREPIISYNLSCYACQLHQLDAARVWLQRALVIGEHEQVKQMALADTDLEPLWPEIRTF